MTQHLTILNEARQIAFALVRYTDLNFPGSPLTTTLDISTKKDKELYFVDTSYIPRDS